MGIVIKGGFFKILGGVFRSVEPSTAISGPITYLNTVTLTTGTSWTKPAGVTQVKVECWGGGGSGGGATVNGTGGSGGGGGGYARSEFIYPSAQQSISYSIGAGGTGGTGNGTAGGDTTWDTSVVIARGGGAGLVTNSVDSGPNRGFGGGVDVSNVGTIIYTGGDGTVGFAVNSLGITSNFGAGGGGAGSTGPGGDADGNDFSLLGGVGTADNGGNGGNGSTSGVNFVGLPGSNYGGGGSGANKASGANKNGGNGAPGLIRVSYN